MGLGVYAAAGSGTRGLGGWVWCVWRQLRVGPLVVLHVNVRALSHKLPCARMPWDGQAGCTGTGGKLAH